MVPAILHPHLWGLHPGAHTRYHCLRTSTDQSVLGLPPPGLQRSLTLIAKALQSLANLTVGFNCNLVISHPHARRMNRKRIRKHICEEYPCFWSRSAGGNYSLPRVLTMIWLPYLKEQRYYDRLYHSNI
jgi:hypothetical protein